MLRSAIVLKFNFFPDKASYLAEKLKAGINLLPRVPDENLNFHSGRDVAFDTSVCSPANCSNYI